MLVEAECYVAAGNSRISVTTSYRLKGRKRVCLRKVRVFSTKIDIDAAFTSFVDELARGGWETIHSGQVTGVVRYRIIKCAIYDPAKRLTDSLDEDFRNSLLSPDHPITWVVERNWEPSPV